MQDPEAVQELREWQWALYRSHHAQHPTMLGVGVVGAIQSVPLTPSGLEDSATLECRVQGDAVHA